MGKSQLFPDEDPYLEEAKNYPVTFAPKDVLLFASSLSSKDTFIAATMVDHHTFP